MWSAAAVHFIVRNIERKPIRTMLSIIGIAAACATMISSGFFKDAVSHMVNVQFVLSQKEDMTVTFIEPTSRRILHELKAIEGVHYAEPYRNVAVKLIHGHRSYKTVINGIEPDSRLYLLLNTRLRPVPLPSEGIMLTDHLGKILDARPGDLLTVELLEGTRSTRQVPVVALTKQFLGVMGYMDIRSLNRLLIEGDSISGAHLTTDALHRKQSFSPVH